MCFVPLNGEGKWRSVLSIRLAGLQRLLAHVGHEENDREDDAECTDDDVADGEEVVAATEHVSGREHKPLLPIEGFDVVEVLDLYNVLALGEAGADLTEELAEVGETGGSHPDDEVFFGDVPPLDILPGAVSAVSKLHLFLVFEFILNVTFPGDVGRIDWDVDGNHLLVGLAGDVVHEAETPFFFVFAILDRLHCIVLAFAPGSGGRFQRAAVLDGQEIGVVEVGLRD